MGAICGGDAEIPEIDVDPATIAEQVDNAIIQPTQTAKQNITDYTNQVNKCDDDGKFEVPDTTLILTKLSTQDDIRAAAVTNAFSGKAKEEAQNVVWSAIEPTIDEQFADVPRNPITNKAIDVAKDKFKEATVDPAVDKAWEAAIQKAKKGE